MAGKSTTAHRGRADHRAGEPRGPRVTVPVIGEVTLPPPHHLAFYAALGVLGALEIIEWPVALVVGAGHLLAQQDRSLVLREAGKAAEAA